MIEKEPEVPDPNTAESLVARLENAVLRAESLVAKLEALAPPALSRQHEPSAPPSMNEPPGPPGGQREPSDPMGAHHPPIGRMIAQQKVPIILGLAASFLAVVAVFALFYGRWS
ncbi:hypothetical protein Ade02nite_29710 [Paractinoplanes deccanensis]|uniref:Uncharacterized protein n=1 Tax=Paractinoplanes deccanensis TaxID=113561 RepID=A0ABQ3Y2Y4_9ACTN|nr:hypothetical protein [Actinoplanes deccanensis]GID74330.1 hypothetical protein Ade02nite_29710 [Actinoplanes deccanensis]